MANVNSWSAFISEFSFKGAASGSGRGSKGEGAFNFICIKNLKITFARNYSV